MNKEIKNVVVYASASPDVDEIYYKTATELANIIVKEGFGIVYGGSRRGLMYACAGNVQNCGGRVVGVMPQKFVDWIYWKLGNKIAEDYMIPYNQKMFNN